MEEKDLEFLNSFTEKLEKTVVDLCSADELLDAPVVPNTPVRCTATERKPEK